MSWLGSPYAVPLGLAALLSLALALYGWRRPVRGARAFTVFNLGVAVWTGAYLLELGNSEPDAVFWANFAYFGIVVVPASWLVFALRFSGDGRRVTTLVLTLLFIEPLATLFLVWTNPWHELIRRGLHVAHNWEPGPAFWVHAAYSYALVLAGTLLVARRITAGPRLWRGQASALLIGAFAPWTANALYLAHLSPFGNLDLSPFGFALTSLAVAWGLFRERLLDLVPVAREAVLEGMTDGVIVLDSSWRVVDLNPAAEELLGRSAAHTLGLQLRSVLAGVAETVGTTAGETVLGEPPAQRWIAYRLSALLDAPGGSSGSVVVLRDVTQSRRAEEVLLQTKSFLQQVVDTSPSLIFVLSHELRFVLANRSMAQYYGTTPEQMLGKTAEEVHPDRAERRTFVRSDLEALEAGRAVTKEERSTAPDGTLHWFHSVRVPLVQPDRTTGILVIATDITQRKHAEEALLQSRKIEAIGQLAGGVAHDFNNILGVIMGYGQLAQRQLGPENPVRARVDQMLKAAERAAGLTRQLLAFSRKQVMQPRLLDLNAIVADTQKMLGRLIGEDITLVVDPGPDLGTVNADPVQVEQIILNLAVNARDAMPKGGRLTLATANIDLDEDYAAANPPATPGRYVMLAVSDTGVGMDQETQQRIFEPFFTTKPEGQGTGLGLATVYGIVKQSGGHVCVHSEPGRGTTFKVFLPRVDEPTESARPAGPPAEAPRGHETILLVEDTEMLRSVIRETLEESGYTVLPAADGEEALALAHKHSGSIDLLLTDVVMPRLGGGELAKRLSALRPQIRVLYMSGYANGAISQHGVLEEGVMLLEKPFTWDKLALAVREALDRRAPRA